MISHRFLRAIVLAASASVAGKFDALSALCRIVARQRIRPEQKITQAAHGLGLGKVLGNLMVDVKATNAKMRDRAVRIVRELTGADHAIAEAALRKTDWKIQAACRRLGRAKVV